MSKLYSHPFKIAIQMLIESHFAPEIARRFHLNFEAETFSRESRHIRNQLKDDNLILEVWYELPTSGFSVYVTDLFSWKSKAETEARLLRFITDKVKANEIGQDWEERNGEIRASKDFTSSKYETQSE